MLLKWAKSSKYTMLTAILFFCVTCVTLILVFPPHGVMWIYEALTFPLIAFIIPWLIAILVLMKDTKRIQKEIIEINRKTEFLLKNPYANPNDYQS